MSILSKKQKPTDVTVVVNGSLMNVYDNLYKVLSNLEHSIEYANYDERVIRFKTSMTLTDWGFSFSVTLKPQGENQTQLSFYGLHLGKAEGRDPLNVGKKRVTQILNALNEMPVNNKISTNIREEASSEPKTTQQDIFQNVAINNLNESKGFFKELLIGVVILGIALVGFYVYLESSGGSSSYHGNNSIANSYAGVYTIKGVRGDTSDRWRFELNAKTMKASVDLGDEHYNVDWDVISSSKGVVINCRWYHTVFVISPQRVLYTMDTDTYNTTPLFNLTFQKY